MSGKRYLLVHLELTDDAPDECADLIREELETWPDIAEVAVVETESPALTPKRKA